MKALWAIARREFIGYFVTPVGYVVTGVYVAITGIGFLASFIYYARISQNPAAYEYPAVPDFEETMLSPFLVFCGQVMIFLGPLITMRLLAEERHRGSLELLLSYPVRDADIIFGKYLAALGLLVVMMGGVFVHMGIVAWFTTVEPAVLVLGLLAVFLMGAAFVRLGLFISAFANNPITSATATFGAFFISYILGAIGKDLSENNPASATWNEHARALAGFVYNLFRQLVLDLPIDAHARQMTQGNLQIEDIVYYIVFTAFFLFLTFRVFEARKWRWS